jgi:hypothetical protein
MVDSGADISIVKKHVILDKNSINSLDNVYISGISSTQNIKTLGAVTQEFFIQNQRFKHKFYVVDTRIAIDFDGILGGDFLTERKAIIDYGNNAIEFNSAEAHFIIPFCGTSSINSVRSNLKQEVFGDKGPVSNLKSAFENSQHQTEQQFLRPINSNTENREFKIYEDNIENEKFDILILTTFNNKNTSALKIKSENNQRIQKKTEESEKDKNKKMK